MLSAILVLRVGAVRLLLHHVGRIAGWTLCSRPIAANLERAGALLTMGTPVVRVVVAGILFLHEKDWKYGAISFGVLTIPLLSALFGIGEH